MKTAIVNEPQDVVARLAELGLEVEPLQDVGRSWYMALKSSTPNHPRNYPGFCAWAEGVRQLRDYLVPKDWERLELGGYPLTLSPQKTHCIALATGDENTGDPYQTPSNKAPKGPRTEQAVAANVVQYALFAEADLPEIEVDADEEKTTFILLIHLDLMAKKIRMELSVPTSIHGGRIDHWEERIFLPDVPINGDELDFGNPPSGPDFDIEITRKVA